MTRTKVIRVHSDFVYMLDEGKKGLQMATGKRISTPKYTQHISEMMKPLLALESQVRNFDQGIRGRKKN